MNRGGRRWAAMLAATLVASACGDESARDGANSGGAAPPVDGAAPSVDAAAPPVDGASPPVDGAATARFAPAGRVTALALPDDAEAAGALGCRVLGSKGGAGLAPIGQFTGEGGLAALVTPAADGSIGLVLLFQVAGFDSTSQGPAELRAFYGDLARADDSAPTFTVDPTSLDADGLAASRWPETRLDADGALSTSPARFTLRLPVDDRVPPVNLIFEQTVVRAQAARDAAGVALSEAYLEGYLTRDSLLTLINDFRTACQAVPAPDFCSALRSLLNPTAAPEATLNIVLALVGGYDVAVGLDGPADCSAQARDCNAVGVCLKFATAGVEITGLAP